MRLFRCKRWLRNIGEYSLFVLSLAALVFSQNSPNPERTPLQQNIVVYAVLGDGTYIEPVGYVDGGQMADSSGMTAENEGFVYKSRYAAGRKYSLVFGGARVGDIEIKEQMTGDCAGDSAQILIRSSAIRPKGFVMALATDAPINSDLKRFRRRPSVKERADIEELVRQEFAANSAAVESKHPLRYFNLTAIDVDRDGIVEFVGSYWSAPEKNKRAMLFFIAERLEKGSYSFNHKEFTKYTGENVMSGEVADTDDGTYHELLLDYFDMDADGVAEIFTTTQAFEGRNFAVYRRVKGKWTSVFTSYNYRCGY